MLVPLPHGVVPAGQPQKEAPASMHATPLLQQFWPQGVVPLGQQQARDGLVHVSPRLQQADPQGG
jgi:hypothetical protein